MKDGIITLAAGVPRLHLADPAANVGEIVSLIRQAADEGACVLVLPRLCVTGCTCGDLFSQTPLLRAAEKALLDIAADTADADILAFVGVPLTVEGRLYSCAAALHRGKILGIVPQTFIPRAERHFSSAPAARTIVTLGGAQIPFGTGLLFSCASVPELTVGAEIGEDAFLPVPPSVNLCAAGASVIVHPDSSPELVRAAEARRNQLLAQGGRLSCAYVHANAGPGESSTDLVYGGCCRISDGAQIRAVTSRYEENDLCWTPVDLAHLLRERQRGGFFDGIPADVQKIPFDLPLRETELIRPIVPAYPFVPAAKSPRSVRCREILDMQSHGLARRLTAAHAGGAVIAVSGGLDSTLALLVTARAFDLLGWEREKITTVTMPCYGTTGRTRSNAQTLSEELGTSFREIPIAEAVDIHFRDIGHDPDDHSVTYENSQARERTQIIMDLANKTNSLVIGTGDLSELALGWATYNGDHMSNYGVNGGLPKTLIRHIVSFCADDAEENGQTALAAVLRDILATPVSPELLPAKDGEISQKTEDIVGPYDLHDFFLYCIVRRGYSPAKIFRLAKVAFAGQFEDAVIAGWLTTFCRRFFTQQFKRSCLPDGVKIGSVGFSPRGDWQMPSDALSAAWMAECEAISASLR